MSFVIVNMKPYDSRPMGVYFVSREGSAASYTRMLQHARQFGTREQAERNQCVNEQILTFEEAMRVS